MSWIPAFQFARSGERASRMEVGLSDPQFPQVVPVPTPVFVCLIPDSFPAGGLNFYGIPRERAKSIKNSFIFLVSPFVTPTPTTLLFERAFIDSITRFCCFRRALLPTGS